MDQPSIDDLYTFLSAAERDAARENLDAYLELAWEIYEEMQGRNADA